MTTIPHEKERNLLREQVLRRVIDGAEFVEAVQALDQSTPEREDAPANLELLLEPAVADCFAEGTPARQAYLDLLSLTHVHLGQIRAYDGSESALVLEHFENAHAASLAAGADRHRAWRTYIAATIAYLKSDLVTLREQVNLLPHEDKNRPILLNFIRRLERGDAPDYCTDYVLDCE